MSSNNIYQALEIEKKWYKVWEEAGVFQAGDAKDSYCIILPPPNVTGSLHMGHAFQDTIMDVLIRYQRMQGKATLWQPGTDHAGIATQMVVERQLQAKNITKEELGRDDFVEQIWQWKEKSGGTIYEQMKRLGASCDWQRARFTMDKESSAAVLQAFVKLHEDGLIYRGMRLVNWDSKLQTAVSDLEVISSEEKGILYHVRYPIKKLKDSAEQEYITIATSRPETIPADVAIAVHPEDKRYLSLIGREVVLPLTNRNIKIIADSYAKPDFGSGAVKITPAHDFNDWEVGQRHALQPINLLNKDASMNNNMPKQYQGMSVLEARGAVVADLKDAGLLIREEEYTTTVSKGDRSGVAIEPYLTYQWFVKTEPLAKEALSAVKDGKIKFYPENWVNTYYSWLNDIQDWCISRQLWWGHQIPAWYDDAGNIYVAQDEKSVRSKYNLPDDISLRQDEDVLDTWFSSALWPFSTLGWPNHTQELDKFFPTTTLVTGFDIIFFWVARMIMFSLYFTKQVPFKDIYVHGLIQDQDGQKMSKSKGNVIDPIDLIDGISLKDLIEKRTANMMQPKLEQKIAKATQKHFPEGISAFGTDPLRFTFCALASFSRQIRFDLKRIEGYRNFCNKLWNAARYIEMNADKIGFAKVDNFVVEDSLINQWLLASLQDLKLNINKHIDVYRFDLAANAIYDFVWGEFCDWYLELSKPMLQEESQERQNTMSVLLKVFSEILLIIHPFMPFITEELYQNIAKYSGKGNIKTIAIKAYPKVEEQYINKAAQSNFAWLREIIVSLRTLRSKANISPAKKIDIIIAQESIDDRAKLEKFEVLIKSLAKVSSIKNLQKEEPLSATTLVGSLKILVPLEGLIDLKLEEQRLTKELTKLEKEYTKIQKKLSTEAYLTKAPAENIAQEKEKAKTLAANIETIREQKNKLSKHLSN